MAVRNNKLIRGYVSSDEDDSDDYDFGYSEPLEIEKKKAPVLPKMHNEEDKQILYTAISESQKIDRLFRATQMGNLETVEELISQGLSADITDSQGWSPLIRACGMGDFEIVQFLLGNGADPNKHRELLTPLMTCCTHTTVEEDLKLNCIRLLLQHGAEVNAKDKFQTTALMYAAGSNYANIVAELLAVPGINVNMQDNGGWTALFHAVNQNYKTVVEILLAAGAKLNLKDNYNRTVVNLALEKNYRKLAAKLGYVEEVAPVSRPKTLKERFLMELPDSNGEGGFCSDARWILNAFNQFDVQEISLPDLLNATDKDLYRIGVKLRPDRHKILTKAIHRFHLRPWWSTSMKDINPGVEVRLEDVISIMGSLAKHLTLANASLIYTKNRASSWQNGDSDMEKEMALSVISICNSAGKLKASLSKVLKHIEQVQPEIPPDFIYPRAEAKPQKKRKTFFWYFVGAATAGLLIYNPTVCCRTLTKMLSEFLGVVADRYDFFS